MDPRSNSLLGLDLDRGSVTKDLGHALHDLGCVIAQTDDGVSSNLLCMLHAKLERMLARFLTKIGENGDVAADQGLQSCADCPENRARSHNDAAHHSEIFYDPVTIQFKRRGCHRWVHSGNLGTVQPGRTGVLPSGGRTVLRSEFRAGSPK